MKISKKWRRMQQVYLYFAEGRFDLSEAAALAMYRYESCGEGELGLGLFSGEINGYVVAKHWLNVTVARWRESLQQGLSRRDCCRRLQEEARPSRRFSHDSARGNVRAPDLVSRGPASPLIAASLVN
jgi:hypothetical protein